MALQLPMVCAVLHILTSYLVFCNGSQDKPALSTENRWQDDNMRRSTAEDGTNVSNNSCPNVPCFCDARTRQVVCSGKGLTRILDGLPQNLEHLNLVDNYLTTLTEAKLQRFPDLVSLNVSNNLITYISPEAFIHNSRLETLDLEDNLLGRDSGLMMFLCSMSTSFVHLGLGGNGISEDKLNLVTLCKSSSLQELDIENNNISGLPPRFLETFPNLESLNLEGNLLTELPESLSYVPHSLHSYVLANNRINVINCSALENFSNLHSLDLGYNLLQLIPEGLCSEYINILTYLDLSGNPLKALTKGNFRNLSHLTDLQMSHLPNLNYLGKDSLAGLSKLQHLDLSHNRKLEFIHAEAFSDLDSLKSLDLSYCNLSHLHKDVFQNLTSLTDVLLTGNSWHCDCDLKWMSEWFWSKGNQHTLPHSIICTSPLNLTGSNILDMSISSMFECGGPVILQENATLWFRVGSQAVLDCDTAAGPLPKVTWITPAGGQISMYPSYLELYAQEESFVEYHSNHTWHDNKHYQHDFKTHVERILVLQNGSLFIDYITRQDAGNYTCVVENSHGNNTAILNVMLDYSIFQWIKIYTMIVGFLSAFTFFFITITINTIRYLAHKCSSKERRKRKSIREVLNSLYDFKTVQIDRFCAYKTAKINKLSTFKSDKMHKLVAFKTAKVGKLRAYKQVTMASIFHHLEKMREHYHSQMDKVKDNCSQQVEKLRENYGNQFSKFKDYKSEKIERIRDNYNNQVLKIRDYRSQQMNKLRDQYKLQQQYLFKLMELLDIGNCLNVVEAECMRTESMLFDPNISFDLEAQPVHVTRDLDFSSDDSEYLTAGSQSNHSDGELDCSCTIVQDDSNNTLGEGCSHSPTKHIQKPSGGKVKQKHRKKHKSRSKSHRHQGKHHDRQNTNHQRGSLSSSSSDEPVAGAGLQRSDILTVEPPPPPAFSCEMLDVSDMPLEDLIATVCNSDLDALSVYQTPPSSAHQDIEAGNPQADNISTEYESVQQSRNPSPEPTSHRLTAETRDSHDSSLSSSKLSQGTVILPKNDIGKISDQTVDV